MTAFNSKKVALSQTTLRGPTYQLAVLCTRVVYANTRPAHTASPHGQPTRQRWVHILRCACTPRVCTLVLFIVQCTERVYVDLSYCVLLLLLQRKNPKWRPSEDGTLFMSQLKESGRYMCICTLDSLYVKSGQHYLPIQSIHTLVHRPHYVHRNMSV